MNKFFAILSALVIVFSVGMIPVGIHAQDNDIPPPPPPPGTGPGMEDAAPVEGCMIRVAFTLGDKPIDTGFYGPGDHGGPDWGLVCLIGTIHYITNWIFYIIMIMVMIMILYGAFTFLTSSGDTTKTSKATKIITFAIIGMIVALLARAIPATVKFIMGV